MGPWDDAPGFGKCRSVCGWAVLEQARAAQERPRDEQERPKSGPNSAKRVKSDSRAIFRDLGAVLEPFWIHLGLFLDPSGFPDLGFSSTAVLIGVLMGQFV